MSQKNGNRAAEAKEFCSSFTTTVLQTPAAHLQTYYSTPVETNWVKSVIFNPLHLMPHWQGSKINKA